MSEYQDIYPEQINASNMPFSMEAEQAVIGTVLTSTPDVLCNIISKITPEYFYISYYRELFELIVTVFLSETKLDLVVIIDESKKRGILKEGDFKEFIINLTKLSVSPSSLPNYIKILKSKLTLRKISLLTIEINSLIAAEANADDILDICENKLSEIRSEKDTKELMEYQPVLKSRMERILELVSDPDSQDEGVVSSTFRDLDKCIHGLSPANLIIVAGRPGMGKTTFALNIAVNVGKRYLDKQIAIFSLEMSKEELVDRIICSEVGLTSEQIKSGRNIPDRVLTENIPIVSDILKRINILVNESSVVSVADMKSQLRRVKNLGLVVIDYLQLMSSHTKKNENRASEVADISRNLKIMAKELGVPIIVAAQLSRGAESRTDKRPLLSDLRESGAIEQDADVVLFLYREYYYNKECDNPNLSECIIAKNRHGETGSVMLNFEGEYARFTSVAHTYQ